MATTSRDPLDPKSGRLSGDIDDDDIEATDVGDDFAENDEIDPDLPIDIDENDPALDEKEQIRDLKLDIDEIEND
jgi:hypothetical protein